MAWREHGQEHAEMKSTTSKEKVRILTGKYMTLSYQEFLGKNEQKYSYRFSQRTEKH